ncbi:hypothetical protein [Rhizobium sp. 42MFCr.1]|nr:hypothetical protein [Rhizobium sp. 42MFCr.1]
MTSTERPESDIEHPDCPPPVWGEWWPEAWEQRELDNADAEVSSPLP